MCSSRISVMLSFGLSVAIAAVAVIAVAQQTKDPLLIEEPIDHDLYAADREVSVQSTVDGDLVAAGSRINVDAEVTGDVIVAAQDITINAQVNDDLRAAGRHIRVTSPVSGHIVAAGQTVTIEKSVGDWAWLAGDTVEVRGNVGGELRIRARRITIDAEVGGNVELLGEELNIGANAVVRGDLVWRSNHEANISPEATIEGEFLKEPLPGVVEDLTSGRAYALPLNLIAAVIVLFLLFSRPLRATADQIATHPGRSLVLGFVVFSAPPVLGVILLFTGIGVWLGLTVILIFLLLLLLGVMTGLFAASDLALRRIRLNPQFGRHWRRSL